MSALHADFKKGRILSLCSHRNKVWEDETLDMSTIKKHRLTRCRGCGKWQKLWENSKENAPSDHLVGEWFDISLVSNPSKIS